MWIKTQDDASGNCLVNLAKAESIMHIPNTMDASGAVIAEMGGEDEYYTLFEGTQEDCEACLDWIMNRLDWKETTCDINDWIESRKPVKASDFPEETGKPADPDEIPF